MQRLKTWTVRGVVAGWVLLMGVVLFFNVRLYAPSPLAENQDRVPPQLLAQLAANRAALDAGAPAEMQKLFPEGYYFSYLFHGLTWVELAMRDSAYADQASAEAAWCLQQIESPAGMAPFPPELPPDHGMFYAAWKCHLRGGIVLLQQGRDAQQLATWQAECDAIAAAIEQSATPFLPSYRGAAWPCDTVPAIHALCTYDHWFHENRYARVVKNWLIEVDLRHDPQTGLLFPHTASLPDGREVSGARATSQVIVLRLLPDIQPLVAKQEYETFRRHFLTNFLGAPCIWEYPAGTSGPGDVDSGPLIFGRSLSATVFLMGVAQVYGDQALADAIAQCGEVVGLPWTSYGKKQYAAGLLPIGDIMVAYAQVARPWFAQSEHRPEEAYAVSPWWRWPIHAVSLVVLLPLVIVVWRRCHPGSSPN